MKTRFVPGLFFLFSMLPACGGEGSGGAHGSGGDSSGGASSGGAASGGQAGGGGTGGLGGSAGLGGASGLGGQAGAAGDAGAGAAAGAGGSGGSAPMCSTSSECKPADVSAPGSTTPPTSSPTECVGGRCGIVTAYSGSYQTPKPPKSCNEICAASLYDGQPMKCSPECAKKKINGFGDQGLFYEAGALGGLLRYQFSSLGSYHFYEASCAQVPTSKVVEGSNSYKYVNHQCCCVAP